jgi:2-phosphosulfolactate phosphatase
MYMIVAGGRLGAQQAAERQDVAIIVDALRASATTASLLQFGAREIIVLESLESAFAERGKRPESWLAGERGGLKVEGFDLGNSPLQQSLPGLPETVVFSSSNMSRCCVGAATCPAVFLGTLPTLTAAATVALRAAQSMGRGITLVPAGSVLDECKLVLEDYVTAGALMDKMNELSGGEAVASGDAARAAQDIWQAAKRRGVERTFVETDNGVSLASMGLGEDVRFASRSDMFSAVPQVTGTYLLEDGERAAVLTAAK